jgi:hypothetical protein
MKTEEHLPKLSNFAHQVTNIKRTFGAKSLDETDKVVGDQDAGTLRESVKSKLIEEDPDVEVTDAQ